MVGPFDELPEDPNQVNPVMLLKSFALLFAGAINTQGRNAIASSFIEAGEKDPKAIARLTMDTLEALDKECVDRAEAHDRRN